MKKILTALSVALVVGSTTLVSFDAEAARLGSGRSSGMQRQAVTPQPHQNATPAQNPAQQQAARQQQAQPAAAPQAQPKRSWMGPLAGLAAGLGLAALASHFGFGEELASMMMIGLLVMGVLMVVGFLLRKKAASGPQPAYAGAGNMNFQPEANDQQPLYREAAQNTAATAGAAGAAAVAASAIPADFDTAGFTRQAKVNFIRLQAANDAGNLDDLREFTSPEMFGELKMDITERGQKPQQTDVVSLEAEVLEVAEDASRYIVSVRFTGMLREEKDAAPAPFAEIWHMSKPRDGAHGWVLAGIQQLN